MKEEIERLYKVEQELKDQLYFLQSKYNRVLSTLETIKNDKWARTQQMKYCDITVGELVDECLNWVK